MLSCTQQFLNLSFYLLPRIISNSGLNITSELKVFDAIHKLMSYNIVDRKWYTRKLLSYLPLTLLSCLELNYVLHEISSFEYSNDIFFDEIWKVKTQIETVWSYTTKPGDEIEVRLIN